MDPLGNPVPPAHYVCAAPRFESLTFQEIADQ
eukprot:COSAG02_NODE_70865_length_193_cov_61.957447_1_plen_31_part_10